MRRILVAGPVRQTPEILRAHLDSVAELELDGIHADRTFVDDNDDPRSSDMLRTSPGPGSLTILTAPPHRPELPRDVDTHHWDHELIWRVGAHKDRLLALARAQEYDAIFLVDSDLVLHPATLSWLDGLGLDIVAEVFWTAWTRDAPPLPQVWLGGQYRLHPARPGEASSPEEEQQGVRHVLGRLGRPGVYDVGGLGACTLISRRALDRGVSFAPIDNLDLWGEDRHFCVRARVLGLRLYADTHLPPLHLYRHHDLGQMPLFHAAIPAMSNALRRVEEARRAVPRLVDGARMVDADDVDGPLVRGQLRVRCREGTEPSDTARPFLLNLETREMRIGAPSDDVPSFASPRRVRGCRVLASIVFRNEASRYLRRVVESAARWADRLLLVDDASTDESVAVARDAAGSTPHRLVELERSLFPEEWRLRELQWRHASAEDADWIVVIDADEIFEDDFAQDVRVLASQDAADVVRFRLYDMWDADHYRDDELWNAHRRWWPLMVRNDPNLSPFWEEKPLHCGRLPPDVAHRGALDSPIRVQHLGWMDPTDRARKLERYLLADPDGRWGVAAQYTSILDPNPRLTPWQP